MVFQYRQWPPIEAEVNVSLAFRGAKRRRSRRFELRRIIRVRCFDDSTQRERRFALQKANEMEIGLHLALEAVGVIAKPIISALSI